MKKHIFLAMLFISIIAMAQDPYRSRVGINTYEPKATLDVSRTELDKLPEGQAQGILFPRFTTQERADFTNVTETTMIYNTTKNCLEIYKNAQWKCLGKNSGSRVRDLSLDQFQFTDENAVAGIYFSPTLAFSFTNHSFLPISVQFLPETLNASYSEGIKSIFSYTHQQGDALNMTTFNIKELQAGKSVSFNSQSLYLNVSNGRYIYFDKPGVLKANFSHLGMSGETTIKVNNGKADLINREHYILSMAQGNTVIQGKINNTTNKINLQIPYLNGLGI